MLLSAARHNRWRQFRRLLPTTLSLVLGLALTGSVALLKPTASAAEANRVTICHRTGSQSNPYLVITIDEHALRAHLEHEDLYPVPPGGCPTEETPTQTPTHAPTNTPTQTPTNTPTITPIPTETIPPDPGPDGLVRFLLAAHPLSCKVTMQAR